MLKAIPTFTIAVCVEECDDIGVMVACVTAADVLSIDDLGDCVVGLIDGHADGGTEIGDVLAAIDRDEVALACTMLLACETLVELGIIGVMLADGRTEIVLAASGRDQVELVCVKLPTWGVFVAKLLRTKLSVWVALQVKLVCLILLAWLALADARESWAMLLY